MNKSTIQLNLSLEEVNKVLGSMGNLPYAQVFALIQKIQGQTEKQLQEIQPQTIKPAPASQSSQ